MRFRTKKTKDYHLVIKVGTSFRETVDQQTLETFALKNIPGSFKPVLIRKRHVKYIGIPGIPLSEYLKEPLSKYDFLLMMERLLLAGKHLRENGFSADHVAADLSHVYINQMTKEIQLIYLPLLGNQRQNVFMELVQTVVYAVTSSEGNTEYLSRYINFLRNLCSLDTENIEKLENYIANEKRSSVSFSDGSYDNIDSANKQKGKGEEVSAYPEADTWSNQNHDTLIVNEERMPAEENAVLYERMPDGKNESLHERVPDGKNSALHERVSVGKNESLHERVPVRENTAPQEQPTVYDWDGYDDDNAKLFDDDADSDDNATLLDDDTAYDDRTILLDEDESDDGFPHFEEETDFLELAQEIPRMPVLYRIATGETIQITKKVFRLGKDESCVDYAISDNHAVSRSHADIICRAGKYYVFDLGSKNKTFINNRALPSQYEVEINNGDTLKVANEELEFRW